MNILGVQKIAEIDCQLRHVCLSVPLSVVRVELLGSHWKDFHEILYLIFLENLSRKFKFH
jgi:hypothetical protein